MTMTAAAMLYKRKTLATAKKTVVSVVVVVAVVGQVWRTMTTMVELGYLQGRRCQ